MTASPTNHERTRSAWTWPVDLRTYDRTPTLSEAEYDALADRVQRSDAGHALFSVHMAPVLQRLTRPLADVFDLTGALPQVRREVTHLFLREMYFRQAAIWGWTHDDWVDLFNVERPQRLAHRLSFYRHQVFVIGYVLCEFTDFSATGHVVHYPIAVKVFGKTAVDSAIERVQTVLLGWGYSATRCSQYLTKVMCVILLANRSPRLEDLTTERLTAIVRQSAAYLEDDLVLVSRVLVQLGILARPVTSAVQRETTDVALQNVPTIWGKWCQRWRATSTLAPSTRQSIYYYLLTAGRWLAQTHPEVETPEDWTRDLAIEYVAAVDRMTVGQWANHALPPAIVGKPLAPRVKVHHLSSIRVFFRDCQEWGWITRRFDPGRCLRVPRSVRALVGSDPRVIADDVWAKLLWAGLNLTADDLLRSIEGVERERTAPKEHRYPLAMVRAVVLVWLFAGLRNDEIRRLRVGCVRWHRGAAPDSGKAEPSQPAVCLLDIPTNKTGTAFTKPVDRSVGEAISAWEELRPTQPAMVDQKTGEVVHYLFTYRNIQIGKAYLNRTVIPILCHKAGLPEEDTRGPITCHRARSTIASQLANAKDPMTLLELQAWLGHRSPESTRHYVRVAPTKLAQSYTDAEYFGRNLRTIEVLIDRDAVQSGAAAAGEPWKYYDLGHGYCTYDFFDQCPHRMACAKCAFYRPKSTLLSLLEESKAHLLRMRQEIPLTDEELAALEGDLTATDQLIANLADVPTPSGPTPRQLEVWAQDAIPLVADRR